MRDTAHFWREGADVYMTATMRVPADISKRSAMLQMLPELADGAEPPFPSRDIMRWLLHAEHTAAKGWTERPGQRPSCSACGATGIEWDQYVTKVQVRTVLRHNAAHADPAGVPSQHRSVICVTAADSACCKCDQSWLHRCKPGSCCALVPDCSDATHLPPTGLLPW